MSVESTTLERSALERKDREELTTIAQALGVKPPSRARKAPQPRMNGMPPSRMCCAPMAPPPGR